MFTTSISQFGWWYALSVSFVNILFFAIFAYFDYFILFPRYAKDRLIAWHIGALVVAAIVFTPIKTAALIITSTGNADIQNILKEDVFFIYISTFLVGVGTSIFSIVNAWMVERNEMADLESKTLQSELKFLKSQINPHFLFNTLNSLYAHTLKKTDDAPDIVLKLSEMMRYMLYDCNEKEVFLDKEIKYIQNYLDLESIRHGGRIDIKFEIDGQVNQQKIAPLIMMPFIENAFKHGTTSQINEAFVYFKLNVDRTKLFLNLRNSKAASIPKPIIIQSGGIGLTNVKRRLDILYPNKHHLHIDESPKEYQVSLQIDL